MAEPNQGKKKIYFAQGDGRVYTKDLKDKRVGVPPGKFSKRFRGFKAKIAPKDALPNAYTW